MYVEDIRDIDYPRQSDTNNGNSNTHQSRAFSTQASQAIQRSITSIEFRKANGSKGLIDRLSNRQTTCGELRWFDVGRKVTLVGWIERKTHGKFLHLRDGYGQTQIVLDNENTSLKLEVATINPEMFIKVTGTVVARPATNKNMAFETGEIEVLVDDFQILDPTAPYDGPILFENKPESESDNNDGDVAIDGDNLESPAITKPSLPPIVPKVNKYTSRTHNCGELSEKDIGKEVVLSGWLEFERMRKFFTLRDGYGCTQVMLPEDKTGSLKIENIPYESVLQVKGIVMARPPGMRNETMATGGIEVILQDLEVLNTANPKLPIQMREHNRAGETLRMEYRYIDLRFSDMQKNLRTRSKVLMRIREYLINVAGFVEVETPTLFRKTPGGAQEFIVPTRKPGHFYSLVQSPQQFKQMLMVGAIDRYFQIARCYRDEPTRPDRQPEFTQLDIELSFTDRDKILELIENVLAHCWPENCGAITTPFPRLTYNEAMESYGSDKPDLRFDMKLTNISETVALNETITEQYPDDFGAYGFVIKAPHSTLPNQLRDNLSRMARQQEGAKFVIARIVPNAEECPALIKTVGSDVAKKFTETFNLENNDVLFFSYGNRESAQLIMGRTRVALRDNMEKRGIYTPSTEQKLCWIVDFPMFCKSERPNALDPVHHPFTAVHADDAQLLKDRTDLLKIRSQAYDLVLNGQEIGGGSIRIHNPKMQRIIIKDYLNLDEGDFTHLLDALGSGCPPHGGIALGIDRLLAIMCNAASIRDVIAFPKGMDGKDHLSKAPCPISDDEKQLYSIEIANENPAVKASVVETATVDKSSDANKEENVTNEVKDADNKIAAVDEISKTEENAPKQATELN